MEKAAILGGPKAVTSACDKAFRWPIIEQDDEEAVLRVMRDGDLSTHPVSQELEEDYRNYFKVRHAISHCNGTSALHASFFALGLQPGDEILVPSATWWASLVPMMWLGLVPVFCESEGVRCGLCPEDLEKKITSKTKAIVVVHLWGMPSRMSEILAIGKKHNLYVIEDASHAHGAEWRGKKCGTIGDIGVFSLQSHKLAPAGEGGILLTNDDQFAERVSLFGDVIRIWKLESPAKRFAATSFGIKTRIAPLSAAVGRTQLQKLDRNNQIRNQEMEKLSNFLEQEGFHTFLPPPHVKRVYFEFLLYPKAEAGISDLDLFIKALQAEGVQAYRPRYPLVHQQPFFTEGAFKEILRFPADIPCPNYLPNALPKTQAFNDMLFRLPVFVREDAALMSQYMSAVKKVRSQWSEIASGG